MATQTTLLGLTKPDYSENQDIGVINANMDTIDKEIGKRTRVNNLLDNSNFINPVNQRGQTSYTGSGYTIDRWRIYSAATVSVTAAGLVVDATTVQANLQQNMETLPNGTFTFVAKVNGNVVFRVVANNNGTITTLNNSKAAFAGGYLSAGKGSSAYYVQIANSVGYTNTIEWVALYAGEYTMETLPTYMPKGYAAELLECQRYYYRIEGGGSYIATGLYNNSTNAIFPFELPTQMRITPTIKYSNVATYRSGEVLIVTNLIILRMAHPNRPILYTTVAAGGTQNNLALLYFDGQGYIEFSADL